MQIPSLRRTVAVLLCVLTVSGCSRAVNIPREEFAASAPNGPGEYRVRTVRGDEYIAERFSVTDSTLVIEKGVAAPMAIPREDVASVHRIERHVPLYVAIGGVILFIGAVALVTGGDAFTD